MAAYGPASVARLASVLPILERFLDHFHGPQDFARPLFEEVRQDPAAIALAHPGVLCADAEQIPQSSLVQGGVEDVRLPPRVVDGASEVADLLRLERAHEGPCGIAGRVRAEQNALTSSACGSSPARARNWTSFSRR